MTTRAALDLGPHSVSVSAAPSSARLGEWDDLVRACPSADVAQLSGWARTRAAAGLEALYVLVEEDGRVVGGAQVLVRRIPVLGRAGYVSYGPVVAPSAIDPAAVHAAVADGLARAGRDHLRMLFVQPPLRGEPSTAMLRQRGFRPSEAAIAPAASVRLDLGLDVETLRRNLTRRLRKWVNRWESQGITVRPGGEDDLPLLAELLARTGEHQGFTAFNLDYLTRMYEELSPSGNLLLLVGEFEGRPVAMKLLTGCGGVLTARLAGFDRSSPGAKHNVPAAIHWAAINWAKANGYRWFDFGGLRDTSMAALESGGPAQVEALEGPDRIKVHFGGTPYRYPQAVELIASPIVRAGYDLALRSRAGRALVARAKRLARGGAALRSRSRAG